MGFVSIAISLLLCAVANGTAFHEGLNFADAGKFMSGVWESSRNKSQDDIKTYTGTIAKNHGKFVLEESTVGTTYAIDDQKTASKYQGKKVIVTGTFDRENKMIHVQTIEELA
jgi:hypothetical protein